MNKFKHISHTFSVTLLSLMLCVGILGNTMHAHALSVVPKESGKHAGSHTVKQDIPGSDSLSILFDNSFEETEELQEKDSHAPLWNYIYDFACYETFLRTISIKPDPFVRLSVFTVYNIPIYILFHSWKGCTY